MIIKMELETPDFGSSHSANCATKAARFLLSSGSEEGKIRWEKEELLPFFAPDKSKIKTA